LTLLRVEALVMKLSDFTLGPLTFEVEDNDYVVLFGPNGSGKTTLLKTILGFYRPILGRMLFNGIDITGLPIEKRNIGYVPQNIVLFENMTIRQNIEFGLKFKKLSKEERKNRVERISEILSIESLLDKKPRELSYGQKQLVSIARAIAPEPSLLLLDEPLSNLDPNTRLSIMKALRALKKFNTSIIHVTHIIENVLYPDSKLLFMYKGKILERGKTSEIFSNPTTLELASYLSNWNIYKVYKKKGSLICLNDRICFAVDGERIKVDDKATYVAFKPVDVMLDKKIDGWSCYEGFIEGIQVTSYGYLYSMRLSDILITAFSSKRKELKERVRFCIDPSKVVFLKKGLSVER